eukprot:TRINITY_DN12845_c0_g1_i3.p1 TRINITY_DN12845_c0_g1~~TRINITY_DN12845_c0_g1_i3.p1  ORF type:complete len:444 (+),score=80.70 TRINITY_DN12845_c0_g1_i3:72-1334(+)
MTCNTPADLFVWEGCSLSVRKPFPYIHTRFLVVCPLVSFLTSNLVSTGNYNELLTYPDSVKASSFTVEGYPLCLEDFCGFEIGEFDSYPHVLAIVTRNITYLLIQTDKKEKDEWVETLYKLFEEQSIFYVSVMMNSLIREGQAELRLLSTSVILTGNNPPVCLGKWLISDIRRYGANVDFVFELSQRFVEDNKKAVVGLSTTDAKTIKKRFDEMARSSSAVGHKTHQSISKSSKSMPPQQKPPVLVIPPPISSRLSPPQNRTKLIYTTVEFDSEPSKQIHNTSQPRSDYISVDITATDALYKTVKQTELDNQKYAKELAKKKPYENSIVIAAFMNKLDLDTNSLGELKVVRRKSDGHSPIRSTPQDIKRLSSETPYKSPTSINHRRFSDEPPTLLDYENVSLKGNYENVPFNPFEPTKPT